MCIRDRFDIGFPDYRDALPGTVVAGVPERGQIVDRREIVGGQTVKAAAEIGLRSWDHVMERSHSEIV